MAVNVTVDGQPTVALPGQTVAAVLLSAGLDSWRYTRGSGRPRGLFCGIGVCFDCLVVVNGLPDVRACQRVVRDGDAIATQHGAELPRDGPGASRRETGERMGGPATGHGPSPTPPDAAPTVRGSHRPDHQPDPGAADESGATEVSGTADEADRGGSTTDQDASGRGSVASQSSWPGEADQPEESAPGETAGAAKAATQSREGPAAAGQRHRDDQSQDGSQVRRSAPGREPGWGRDVSRARTGRAAPVADGGRRGHDLGDGRKQGGTT